MDKLIDLSEKGEEETKNISVRMDIALLEQIDISIAKAILAKKNTPRNRSQWIIEVVKKALKEEEKGK